jgi:hypothetical protein
MYERAPTYHAAKTRLRTLVQNATSTSIDPPVHRSHFVTKDDERGSYPIESVRDLRSDLGHGISGVGVRTAGDHTLPRVGRQAEVRSTRYITHLASFAVTQRRLIFLPELADLSYPLET